MSGFNPLLAEKDFAAGLDELAFKLERDPEKFRREQSSLNAQPLSNHPLLPDYSTSGGLIDRGKQHLDESIPNGQKRRTECAYRMMLQGVCDLGVWLRAKGYDV